MDVLIKNVDPKVWKRFKITAVRKGRKMGELFNEIADIADTREPAWERVKKKLGTWNSSDAEEVLKRVSEFRKGFDFRKFS